MFCVFEARMRPLGELLVIAVCVGMFASLSTAAGSDAATLDSPLQPGGSGPGDLASGALILDLNIAALEALRDSSTVRLAGFPLIGEPDERAAIDNLHLVDLQLESLNVFAPNAQVVLGDRRKPDGIGEALPLPDVIFLRGLVAGEADSAVFLALSPHGSHGHVRIGSMTHVLSTPPAHLPGIGGVPMIYRPEAMPDAAIILNQHTCGANHLRHNLRRFANEPPQSTGGVAGGGAPCRVAHIAVETDHEFTGNLFDGNVNSAAAYAALLIAGTSDIFLRDIHTRLEITFLRLWPTPDDPWNGGDMWQQLDQFINHWVNNMNEVPRHAAHYFSGRPLGGGLAYVGALCSKQYGYALSANLQGYFPYPIIDHHNQNWDILVVSHETGHNFGAWHSHDYTPPIDTCGLGDCSTKHLGTLMGYCHICEGGLTNVKMELHPVIAAAVLNYLENDQSCLLQGSDIGSAAKDDFAVTLENEPVTIDVLANDFDSECDLMALFEFDAASAMGGEVVLDPGAGPNGRDVLVYTPPQSFSGEDTFAYSAVDAMNDVSGASVTIDVIPLRPADEPLAFEPMIEVAYYALPNPQVLPNFDLLTPFKTELVPQINNPSTNGNFAGSGLADNVGAVYTGLLKIETPGLYTLYTESDDGSALYIGEQKVVDNDGLHPMVEKSGVIGLASGLHEIRVEFFEHFGGAGLIVRWEGPGVSKQVIPASQWFHEVEPPDTNPGDLNGDGSVGVADLLILLAAWGECPPLPAPPECPADLNGDGVVGVEDLLILLSLWG